MTKRCREEANCNGSSTGHYPHPPKRCCCGRDGEEKRMVQLDATAWELPQWRRKLRLLGVGYEELLLGWFPFEEEDFFCLDKEPGYPWEDDMGFDDIWQIKHINQIPSQSPSAAH